jgi:arylsulfatase A-like enzyme
LWVHYFGVHDDSKHADVPRFGSDTPSKYDHTVAYVDRALAPLLRELDAPGRARPTATIVTSDHGEDFASHRRMPGLSVSRAATRIPLLVKWPDRSRGVVQTPVSLVDIAPTLIALAQPPAWPSTRLDGEDLRQLSQPGSSVRSRVVFSETWRCNLEGRLELNKLAAATSSHRVTLDPLTLEEAFFDASDQEHELSWNARGRALSAQLRAFTQSAGPLRIRVAR